MPSDTGSAMPGRAKAPAARSTLVSGRPADRSRRGAMHYGRRRRHRPKGRLPFQSYIRLTGTGSCVERSLHCAHCSSQCRKWDEQSKRKRRDPSQTSADEVHSAATMPWPSSSRSTVFGSPRPWVRTSTTWSTSVAAGRSSPPQGGQARRHPAGTAHVTGAGPVHRRAHGRADLRRRQGRSHGPLRGGPHGQAPRPQGRDHQANQPPQPAPQLHHLST